MNVDETRRLEEQFEALHEAMKQIAYPETREENDAGIVLARKALAKVSIPASRPS